MFAFYEAVQDMNGEEQLFHVSAAIRNRLVDYNRKRELQDGFYDAPLGMGGTYAFDMIPARKTDEAMDGPGGHQEELEEFANNLMEYGLSLSEVADNCPKQERTLQACHKAQPGRIRILTGLKKQAVAPGGTDRCIRSCEKDLEHRST